MIQFHKPSIVLLTYVVLQFFRYKKTKSQKEIIYNEQQM